MIFEGVGQVECGLHGVVGGRNAWDGDGVRKECDGVGDANGVRFGDENFPTTVVVHGGTDTVALFSNTITIPLVSSADNAMHAALDLTQALQNPFSKNPGSR